MSDLSRDQDAGSSIFNDGINRLCREGFLNAVVRFADPDAREQPLECRRSLGKTYRRRPGGGPPAYLAAKVVPKEPHDDLKAHAFAPRFRPQKFEQWPCLLEAGRSSRIETCRNTACRQNKLESR